MSDVEKHQRFLKKVPMFKSLSDSHLKKLAERVREREFANGELILEQGKIGVGLFIIQYGEVKVYRHHDDGTRREIDVLGETEFFGELSLLDDAPRVAEVVASADTKCLVLSKLDFLEELDHEPQMAVEMLKELAFRFRRVVSNL
jgi:CRP/FNR family transcriptional regulator, cyclic AMP receptor protein